MDDIDGFLEVFGGYTIADAVKLVVAILFLAYVGKKVKEYFEKRHDAEVLKDKKIHAALDAVEKYPEYRKQSIEIQRKLEGDIKSLNQSIAECMKRLDKMEEDTKKRERNKLRDRILQNFRYFTSKEKNPMQAWTRMEAESFWELFKDYENSDGNGYVHSDVQPAMNLLDIIELYETEKITELMKSRG